MCYFCYYNSRFLVTPYFAYSSEKQILAASYIAASKLSQFIFRTYLVCKFHKLAVAISRGIAAVTTFESA